MSDEWNIISVLWSGGLDSTYMIQHLLDSNPNNVVWAYYVEIENNRDKVETEKNAIKTMTPILKQKYSNRFEYCGLACKFSIETKGNLLAFYQMPLWISAVVCSTSDKVKEIAIGYIMNDDAISYLDDFRYIVRSFDAISKTPYPKIIFPLSKINKEMINSKLDRELKRHVVWCEMPENSKPCGRCHSCERSPILKEDRNMKESKCYVLPLEDYCI